MASKEQTPYGKCVIEKIKSDTGRGGFNQRYSHNVREYTPSNVDPARTYLNKTLVALEKDKNGKELTYSKAYQKAVHEIIENGTQDRKIQVNAVHGVEIVMNFTNSDASPDAVYHWANDAMEWVYRNFGGKENVKHAVLHMDEEVPHIHVMVVPIDERGRLCYKSFINGPTECKAMQTKFAVEVSEQHGMCRGVRHSFLKGHDKTRIRKFRENTIGKATVNYEDLMPLPDELRENGDIIPELYLPRRQELEQTRSDQMMSQRVKEQQDYNIKQSQLVDQRISEQLAYERLLLELEQKQKKLQEQIKEQEKLRAEYEAMIKQSPLLSDPTIRHYYDTVGEKELVKMVRSYLEMNDGLQNYPDQELAAQAATALNTIGRWQHEQNKKHKDKKNTDR